VTLTLCALALVAFGVFPPVDVVRVYLLGLLAITGALAVRRMLSRFGRLERSGPLTDAGEDHETPAFFDRALRRIELAAASGIYFEQLRPRLREIAEQRLRARGLRLSSEETRTLLGEEAWVALDGRPEDDRFAAPPEGRLGRVLAALERI
jgi:hypothetical protein